MEKGKTATRKQRDGWFGCFVSTGGLSQIAGADCREREDVQEDLDRVLHHADPPCGGVRAVLARLMRHGEPITIDPILASVKRTTNRMENLSAVKLQP